MKLSDALSSITPTRGATTVITALTDHLALLPDNSRPASLAKARERLEAAMRQQRECHSDYEYWSHEGDIAYWQAVCHLFEAAEISGPDMLPDIPYDSTHALTVMDRCVSQVRWGERVLEAARATNARGTPGS